MVNVTSFPSLLRSMTWGGHDTDEEKLLREPLLEAPEDDEHEDGTRVAYIKRLDEHVVVKVEPKLTRSERLLRFGRSSALSLFASAVSSRPTYMNLSPKTESHQDIMITALLKLALLTMFGVTWLVALLYRQASLTP
ncbi:hypothetical protein ACHHYP_09018 [Achlya hypogyna]|uniref:Transmembrane protein n=1 Tax=Achlya hypogyna TaxID=1202772 RepID=A0A1V9ZJP7_ACHHY|nr:hypothetical protein ACHHYP_09018 [Achlya hypogyna]